MNFNPSNYAKENNIKKAGKRKCDFCQQNRILFKNENWNCEPLECCDFPLLIEKLCPDCHPSFPENKTCKVEGCDCLEIFSLGFCRKHYNRYRRHGDPLALSVLERGKKLSELKRLMEIETDECIIWPYKLSSNGYVQLNIEGKATTAHRYVCEARHGKPIKERNNAAHSCGNSACVNYRHLRWATAQENALDKFKHGTLMCGEKHYLSKLRREDVIEIFKSKEQTKKLAEKYSVSKGTIKSIKSGRSWAWLTSNL